MRDAAAGLYASLQRIAAETSRRPPRITAGFDGCVDSIFRPVKIAAGAEPETYFRTIREFGEYLASRAGRSCAVDMREISVRKGGNMPNLSAALTALGAQVSAVGTLGWPQPDERFRDIAGSLYTLAPAGVCNALQFDDGKIMLSNMHAADDLTGERLRERLGERETARLFSECDAIALVNWAEMPQATDLWRGVLEVRRNSAGDGRRTPLLVDITDCAGRSSAELAALAAVIRAASGCCRTIWSLNSNEAEQLAAALGIPAAGETETARAMRTALDAAIVCIHRIGDCIVSGAEETACLPGFPVAVPRISVGAGDTFNGAFLWAVCMDLSPFDAGRFANAATAQFVRSGDLPSLSDVMELLAL